MKFGTAAASIDAALKVRAARKPIRVESQIGLPSYSFIYTLAEEPMTRRQS